MFNPYCSEQKDGTYLVSEGMVEVLEGKLDFDKLEKISKDEIDCKPSNIIVPK